MDRDDGETIENNGTTHTTRQKVYQTSAAFDGDLFQVATGEGALLAEDATVTVDSCTFSGNATDCQGAAIYGCGTATMLDITASTFCRGAAAYGGAVFNEGSASMSGDFFECNTAGTGGAIYNCGTLSIATSSFGENLAVSGGAVTNGGAVANYGLLDVAGCDFHGDIAVFGGAIHNNGTASVTGSTITGGSARSGGGVHNASGCVLEMSGNLLDDNTAGNYGGALNNLGTATLLGSTFANNRSVYDGGAFRQGDSGFSSISSCVFVGNTSMVLSGGAICNNGQMSVDDSVFRGNQAEKSGGAIYNYGAMSIRNSVFATRTDTIRNAGTMTFGGTIRTAANISSEKSITVESGTELVLDVSVYDGTAPTELLTDFNTLFGLSQENLTISIDMAGRPMNESYVLATKASLLEQRTFKITVDGSPDNSFFISIDETKMYGGRGYSLGFVGGILTISASCKSDSRPGISVARGTHTIEEYWMVKDLRSIDIKAAGTYTGSLARTWNGKANVKISDGARAELGGLLQDDSGSLTTIAMKKRASLVVDGVDGVNGVAKLSTGEGCTVDVAADVVFSAVNGSLSIGKANSVSIGGKLDFEEGRNTIKIGANSTVGIVGGIFEVQSLSLAAGAKDAAKQQRRTALDAGEIAGTAKKDKITLGKYTVFTAESIDLADGESSITAGAAGSSMSVTGKVSGINSFKTGNGTAPTKDGAVVVDVGTLSLTGAKKNTLSIGKFGTATIGSLETRDGVKATVTIGADAVVKMAGANLGNINKLTVAAGAAYKDVGGERRQGTTRLATGNVTGTSGNDTLAIWNFAAATFGIVDLGEGKNSMTMGGRGASVAASGIANVSTLKVASGKKDKAGSYIEFSALAVDGAATGTDVNDTWTFGDGSTASFEGIDMKQGDKDKLSIGKSSVVNAGNIVNVEQVTIGDDGVFKIGSGAGILGTVTGSARDNHLELIAGGTISCLDFGKGEGDSVDFTFDGVTSDAGSYTAIGSCLNVENFSIAGTKIEGWNVAVDLHDGREAWLSQSGETGIVLSWAAKPASV